MPNPAPNPAPIIACTGHRPHKIPQMQSAAYYDIYYKLEQTAQSYFISNPPAKLITGLALGWDTICAEVAIRLGIPIICAIPYPDQAERWDSASKSIWHSLQADAESVHTISPAYTSDCLNARNKWMVDHADSVLALWSGAGGGTKHCITYAMWREKPITNLWHKFINFQPQHLPTE